MNKNVKATAHNARNNKMCTYLLNECNEQLNNIKLIIYEICLESYLQRSLNNLLTLYILITVRYAKNDESFVNHITNCSLSCYVIN